MKPGKAEFMDGKQNYITGSNHSSEDASYLNLCLDLYANYLEKSSCFEVFKKELGHLSPEEHLEWLALE